MTSEAFNTELRSSVKPGDAMTQPFRVVLHKTLASGWVTHLENLTAKNQSKDQLDYYWGHYFQDDYLSAIMDYDARCRHYGLEAY